MEMENNYENEVFLENPISEKEVEVVKEEELEVLAFLNKTILDLTENV